MSHLTGTDMDIEKELFRLHEACSRAIEKAASHDLPNAAVNWGDLNCVDACHYTSVHGDSGFFVLIEEGSPDNYEFRQFIGNELREAGFPNVEVRVEW